MREAVRIEVAEGEQTNKAIAAELGYKRQGTTSLFAVRPDEVGRADPREGRGPYPARHATGSVQSIGTVRRILPSTRSKISSRPMPVIVSPWFLRPTTQRLGSSASRTMSATARPSSLVPQG